MKKLFSVGVACTALFLFIGDIPAVSAGPAVNGEAFVGSKAASEAVLRSQGTEGAVTIVLPELAVEKAAKAKSAADAPPIGPLKIGVGREVPAELNKALDLVWSALPEGGKRALVTVKSPEAIALRLGLSVYQLPDEAELNFFSPSNPEQGVERVTGAQVNSSLARDRAALESDADTQVLFWSPVVRGPEIGMEVYLPADVSPEKVRLGVTKVSHLFTGEELGDLTCPYPPGGLGGGGLRCSGTCNRDVMCSSERVGDLIPAVAKMVFTTGSGDTSSCSGTLINDMDTESQIPYFLSARHCISTQPSASSLETIWFYQSVDCNGLASKEYKTVYGGAVLLAVVPEVDMVLLRLNSPPPNGAMMAGWDSNTVEVGEFLTGIHHPAGDLKKISTGQLVNYNYCETTYWLEEAETPYFFCEESTQELGGFFNILFNTGTTEGGSSGSGLFLDSTHRLVGTLTGGTSSCDNLNGENDYGRFDFAFKNSLNRWLAVSDACNTEPGSWAFCSDPACGPCKRGQGDCDSNDECEAGLVCSKDAGQRYGLDATFDVCERPEDVPTNGTCVHEVGSWEYCTDPNCGPCKQDEGDCDADIECKADLVCLQNVGAAQGFDAAVDLCGPAPKGTCTLKKGDWGYCSDPLCGPCKENEGDCDSDAECAGDLVCVSNVGADHGLPATMDVCLSPDERSCTKSVGDWGYCSDSACGPCKVGEGDCDSDAQCAEGLVCGFNKGEAYGLPSNMDVCELPSPTSD